MKPPDGIELTLFSEPFYIAPNRIHSTLRAQDSIQQDMEPFYASSWTIIDFTIVKQLLTDSRLTIDCRRVGIIRDSGANHPVTEALANMMGLDESVYSRLRRLVQKAFTPESVEAFKPKIERTVKHHITELESLQEVDLVTSYAKPIPTIALAEFLDVDW
jgi:cytochrome P450